MWLIISDTHIGDHHANKNLPKLFALLELYADKNYSIILNGDIFDFAKTLNFDERHRIFISLIQRYKEIIYVEGNHDWFLSGLKNIFIKIQFVKECWLNVNNNIIRVIHGHQYDTGMWWRPRITRTLIRLNGWIYNIFGIDIQHYLKKTWFEKYILRQQEKHLIKKEYIANIIFAGHTHRPCYKQEKNLLYINTGDWIDHTSYAIMNDDGKIKLFLE
jgi:UDP-2,3-diacylglucosamine pyrophosphatase LpxH